MIKRFQYLIDILDRWATILLALYCMLVLKGTLTPFDFTMDTKRLSQRKEPIEWVPFSYICPHCGFSIKNKLLNTVMLVPFGFLLALRRQYNSRKSKSIFSIAFSAFVFSMGIEVSQFFLPARVPSASDVVLNTVGAFFGAQIAIAIVKGSGWVKGARL